ncbi:MAG TPA: hypothetical protein VFO73_14105 [Candidatus Limnocylindrales bacterium]|nr:hypothetical protein [Candidatus Limnocylindrales bacterium]
MSRSAAVLASLLVTLGRPAWWVLALSTFLVRGGALLFLLPIVTIPSPLAVSNILAPVVVPLALGRIGPDVLLLAVVGAMAIFLWLVVGGWLAAAVELGLIREAAAAAVEEGVVDGPVRSDEPRPRDRDVAGGMLATRLVVGLPLAAAVGLGVVRIVAVTYRELTNPSDVALSLPIRVALGASAEIAVIVLAWVAGELIAGLAGRRVALAGVGVWPALRSAVASTVRRPRSTIAPWLLWSIVLWGMLAGLLVAARVTWDQAQAAMSASRPDGIAIAAMLVVFVAVWLGGLSLAGLLAAVRTVGGTFEDLRTAAQRASRAIGSAEEGSGDPGTFGASTHHRPGDWSVDDDGGSL